MPIPTHKLTKFDPPLDTKDKGMPVIGKKPKFAPILTTKWVHKIIEMPAIKSLEKLSGARTTPL